MKIWRTLGRQHSAAFDGGIFLITCYQTVCKLYHKTLQVFHFILTCKFLCLSKVVPVYVLQKKNRNLNRCLFFTLSIIPRFPMDFGKDPFFPISANDLMVGSSLPPPFSVIFFWFWCLWRINRTSRTFSFMDSSNCLATTALSITSSVRQGRQLFQYYLQQ